MVVVLGYMLEVEAIIPSSFLIVESDILFI